MTKWILYYNLYIYTKFKTCYSSTIIYIQCAQEPILNEKLKIWTLSSEKDVELVTNFILFAFVFVFRCCNVDNHSISVKTRSLKAPKMPVTLRQRKKRSVTTLQSQHTNTPEPSQYTSFENGQQSKFKEEDEESDSEAAAEEGKRYLVKVLWCISLLLGACAMVGLGYRHAAYVCTLHENLLWFSNIRVSW